MTNQEIAKRTNQIVERSNQKIIESIVAMANNDKSIEITESREQVMFELRNYGMTKQEVEISHAIMRLNGCTLPEILSAKAKLKNKQAQLRSDIDRFIQS